MSISIKDALEAFIKYNEGMQDALNSLRASVKEHGSANIQMYIGEENFEKANEIINELNHFTNLEFESNADEICAFAESIMKNQPEVKTKPKQEKKITTVSVIKERRGLEEEEKDIIKLIGYTSASRIKDSEEEIDEDVLIGLFDKGYISIEEIQTGNRETLVFELTEKGKKEFEQMFEIEPNESLKSQIEKEHGNLEKGFFLYDIENSLEQREYKINEIGIHQVEIEKDKRHSYLTPDLGHFSEKDYFKILNRKNQLKNIGFICVNKSTLQNAKTATQKWAEQNKAKCKFLNVHFTCLDKIENSPKVFETMQF